MLLSLFNSNPESKNVRELAAFDHAALEALRLKFEEEAGIPFDRLAVLVIDEISFVDATFIGHIDHRLRWLTGNRHAFCGGIILVLSGDNCQKAPPGGTPFHVDLVNAACGDRELVAALQRPDSALASGLKLLRRARRVRLWRIMRAVGDPEFVQAQMRLRKIDDPSPAADIVRRLRLLSAADVKGDEAWRFAPIGVLSHCERDNLNVAQIRAFAQAFGLPLFKWRRSVHTSQAHLLDSLGPAERAAIYEREPALYDWFCEGAPGLIAQTIRSTRKLVNGTPFVFDSLGFEGDAPPPEVVAAYAAGGFQEVELAAAPHSVNVRVSGALWHGVQLDDLTGLAPSLAGDTIVVPLGVGKKDVEADLYHLEAAQNGLPAKLHVRAFAYTLAFALTDFKLQGR